MKKRTLIFWSGMLSNIIDHYDVAIYLFLSPFIAAVFFKQSDPVVALILTYGLMSLGMFTRPIGALLFGRMAIYYGPNKTLIVVLLGMTLSTLAMGLIPSYRSIGSLAPILLASVRMIQGFFAAGEVSVAAMFTLAQQDRKSLGRASSYYACATMLGIAIASLVATWVSATANPAYYWRYAFYASAFAAVPILSLRLLSKDVKPKIKLKANVFGAILQNKYKLLRIILVSGFSYMTYAVPFVFMNSFIPELSLITHTQMLLHSSMLTVFDIVMLLVFSSVVDKFSYGKWMAWMAGLLACTIIPLFYWLPAASLIVVTLLRAWIIAIGVAYLAPLHAWLFKLTASEERYLLTGVGYTLGTELLGRNTTVICWSLFYYFKHPIAPAIYILAVSLAAIIALLVPCRPNNN